MKSHFMKKSIIIIIILVGFGSCDYCDTWKKSLNKHFLMVDFNGIVDSVYLDLKDRNTPKLKIKTIYNPFDILPYDYNRITIGDSVVKEAGTLKILLYKGADVDSPLVLKPSCNGFEFD